MPTLAEWSKNGINFTQGLDLVKDRLLAVNLGHRMPIAGDFLLQLSKREPPATPPWPPTCGNCAGPRVPVTRS